MDIDAIASVLGVAPVLDTLQLKELVGKELFERIMLALKATPGATTGAAATSCSSCHAAPPAIKPAMPTKPARQKRKRKACHVLVGPDVLLEEHAECARIDATNDSGASSYAIEEMD